MSMWMPVFVKRCRSVVIWVNRTSEGDIGKLTLFAPDVLNCSAQRTCAPKAATSNNKRAGALDGITAVRCTSRDHGVNYVNVLVFVASEHAPLCAAATSWIWHQLYSTRQRRQHMVSGRHVRPHCCEAFAGPRSSCEGYRRRLHKLFPLVAVALPLCHLALRFLTARISQCGFTCKSPS